MHGLFFLQTYVKNGGKIPKIQQRIFGTKMAAYTHEMRRSQLPETKTWYVPLEFRFCHVYKLRYMHFQFNGSHLGFPTCVY